MTGSPVEFSYLNATGASFITPKNVEIRDTVDWRAAGAVTPVKHQRNCGACWSFAATGGLEGQVFRKTGRLVSLSEQNLIDCATSDYHNTGCGGGMADRAWQYVKDNGGIDTEESYPYEARNGKCRYKQENAGAKCQGAMYISSGNEKELKEAVATMGPVSVGIDAEASLHQYSGGVYYGRDCNSVSLNHAVLVVGYGTENGQDYWLVKNSWGTSWGERGYIKMSRNRYNNCGIAASAAYPLI